MRGDVAAAACRSFTAGNLPTPASPTPMMVIQDDHQGLFAATHHPMDMSVVADDICASIGEGVGLDESREALVAQYLADLFVEHWPQVLNIL